MFKKVLIIMGVVAVAFAAALPVAVRAAEFASGEQVTITSSKSNLYVAGSTVVIQAPIKKDLVVGGSMVTISQDVADDVIAAGSQVTLNANVGGTVRMAGGQVTLTGTFEEDVIVFGGTVNLQKAIIKGDLIVAAGSLQMNNSQVMGNAYGSYSQLSGDPSQIKGKNELKMDESVKEGKKEVTGWRKYLNAPSFMWEFSMIVFLVVVSFVLHRRGRLDIASIGFNKQFAMDFGLGLVSFGAPLVLFIVGLIVQLFPLAFIAILWWIVMFMISLFMAPIYGANLLRPVWKNMNWPLYVGVAVVYVLMVVFGVVKLLGVFQVLSFVVVVSALGMLLRTKVQMLNWYLMSRGKARK